MKIALTVIAVYLLGVGVAQKVSASSTNSPTADQVAQLPSFSGAGGLLNIGLAIGLLVLAHSAFGRKLIHAV